METEKEITFLGDSLQRIREFPDAARKELGFQLHRVQHSLEPLDWKPMKTVGTGVREIRIHAGGEFRTLYIANIGNELYVLHAFQKKTRKTSQKDIDLAKERLKKIGG